MEHFSNDHEDRSNQHENSHKLYDETGHPVLNLMESQKITKSALKYICFVLWSLIMMKLHDFPYLMNCRSYKIG